MSDQHTHIIKKYPNRRLYDTWASRYITLMDVAAMIRDGDTVLVQDSQNDEDLTRSTLVQIMTEQEQSEPPLFDTDMLMQFIRLQNESTHHMFADFFAKNLDWFLNAQQAINDHLNTAENINLPDKDEVEAKRQALWQEMQTRFFETQALSVPEKDDV